MQNQVNLTWKGFLCEKFLFEGYEAIVVFPKKETDIKQLAIKTEYWSAFQAAVELSLVERGFTLCYIQNENWMWTSPTWIARKSKGVGFYF